MHKLAMGGHKESIRANVHYVLTTFNSLGIVYMEQGKLNKAENLFTQGQKFWGLLSRSKNTATCAAITGLGQFYFRQSKASKTEEIVPASIADFQRNIRPRIYKDLSTGSSHI